MRPAERRAVVARMVGAVGLSERRACGLAEIGRSCCRYRGRRRDDPVLRERLRALAFRWRRFGYRRLTVLLRREGYGVNPKRVHRIYREEGLLVRRRPRKRVAVPRAPRAEAARAVNVRWSMDFMRDVTVRGGAFRTLNVVDDGSRECLAIEVDTSLPGSRVVRVLDAVAMERGYPEELLIDNGPEFTGQALDAWAYRRGVRLQFIEPGRPMQNPYVESFNGKFRDECLNEHWFLDVPEARRITGAWRIEYNEVRPHSGLGNLTPTEFATRLARGHLQEGGAPPPTPRGEGQTPLNPGREEEPQTPLSLTL